MVSVGIIANSDKETIIESINLLKTIPGLNIIFVKQSNKKLYIVTDKVFNINKEGKQ